MVHRITRSPLFWFCIILAVIATVTALGPAEKTLGVNARVVYLHGAWVWAALAAFTASAASGLIGLISQRKTFHQWSRALGRTGLFFWITYLPISVWAMQTNWNGLFLAEPRWRLAVIFGIGGVIMQLGITLIEDPKWASVGNIAYLAALFLALSSTDNVMHPPSPMLDSSAPRIQFFFLGLFILLLLAAWQIARWWRQLEATKAEVQDS
jgi:hypothetical protein